ncbi:MAG TPA: hypothetical protein VGA30_06460 [Actinomycetota bacterium]
MAEPDMAPRSEARGSAAVEPGRTGRTAALGLGLGWAIFAFYFLVYRARHYSLPVGFDAPWYVWRAETVAATGLTQAGTAVRPGHPLLSAVLGAMTGRSQLGLQVMLSLVLVAVLALAVGAFFRAAFGGGAWGWAITVGVTGTFVGATRLVGENIANLLFLGLAAAAAAALARRVEGRPGWTAAVALMVAAGVSHWIFLGLLGAILALTAALGVPESRRQLRSGVPLVRTESGVVASAFGAAAATMAIVIAGVLRAPFQTFEVRENPARYIPKLRTDTFRLFLPLSVPLGLAGAWTLARPRTGHARFGLRLLLAWTVASAVGIPVMVATRALPPHRFLEFWVGLPGVVLLSAAIVRGAEWLRAHGRKALGWAAAVAGIAATGAIGGLAWYAHGPGVWISPTALREAGTAARYVDGLPAGRPFVFLVSPLGKAGVISVPFKEHTIRVALPPDHQSDAHFYVGDPSDLLAGRRSLTGGPSDRATLRYWEDVRAVLPLRPPVLIVQALAVRAYQEAVGPIGAPVIGPGVALLQGNPPPATLPVEPLPQAVPPVRFGVPWGLALLGLLLVAGSGWSVALLGPDAPSEVLVGVAPALGAAVLILGALVAAELGVHPGGGGGVALYVLLTVAGVALAWRSVRSGRTGA